MQLIKMERATEAVKVKTLAGNEAEVLLYKFLPYRKSQQLFAKLVKGNKLGASTKDISVDGEAFSDMMIELAEAYWADKNLSIDDIETESLQGVIEPKLESFLGKFGAGLQVGNNKSGQ